MEKDAFINRKPAVAGTFYPANPKELAQDLQKLYSTCTPNKKLKNIHAVIAPHAGYVYSGTVAASAFNQLTQEQVFDNVFLIGSSHHADIDGAALYGNGNYLTPLGVAKVNLDFTRKLIADHPDIFKSVPEIQANEHSLEVQVPFLQYLYGDQLQIVPIVIATHNSTTVRKISDALAPYFNENNLFVISTDFSHYPDYKSACSIDASTANAILKNSPGEFIRTLEKNEEKGIQNLATSVCGWTSVLALLNITSEMADIRYHEINYMNSGDVAYGDKSRVVGYHAIAVNLEMRDN